MLRATSRWYAHPDLNPLWLGPKVNAPNPSNNNVPPAPGPGGPGHVAGNTWQDSISEKKSPSLSPAGARKVI